VAHPPFDLLTRMTRLICDAVDDVDGCAITVLHRGEPVTVAFSSELAALNDELQYTASAGPCLEALHSQSVVECPDLAKERRWGRYPASALRCGMRSVLSLPMDAAEAGHGALNLYFRRRGSHGRDRHAGLAFADVIAGVVAATFIGTEAGAAGQWHEALAHRAAVAQAVGVLMARHRCGREDAFELLLRSSRERGESVYTTAERIGLGPDPREA
jgi:hypothetical protein